MSGLLRRTLLGELNAGHAYIGWGYDLEPVPRRSVGMLGADLEVTNSAFQIVNIVAGGAWDDDARGPPDQPGVDVREGDFFLEVNGVPLDVSKSPYAVFVGLAGQTVTLTVSAKPFVDEDARKVVIDPSRDEYELRLLLWTHFNDRGAISRPDAATQWIFDIGRRVGELAKRLWPDGIEVPYGRPAETAAHTRALLPRRAPIFEASFLVDSRYCRVDILEPSGDGAWNLIEVKSGTSVKEINIDDATFQADSLDRAGIELLRIFLMHIDNSYVRQGNLQPERLFHREEVTHAVRRREARVTPQVLEMLDAIGGPRPRVPIGTHCDDPYSCALKEQCWAGLPEQHATTLRLAGIKAFGFVRRGWNTIPEIPADDLRPIQRIQQQCITSGKRHIDTEAVREWLDGLHWPVHHLDFETMASPIPIFDGTRPYQQIPFQFSLHVQPGPGADPEHVEFLAMDPIDPRAALLEALRSIGTEGTVLVFNRGFETRVLRELGENLPEYQSLTQDLIDRMEDLAEPFRSFQLYDPAQHGSCSLKRVLPAWTGQSYGDLEIQDGQQAAREYERAVHGNDLGLHRDEVATRLRDYCGQDTWAMVELLRVLQEIAE